MPKPRTRRRRGATGDQALVSTSAALHDSALKATAKVVVQRVCLTHQPTHVTVLYDSVTDP
jgi:hypothetical protein